MFWKTTFMCLAEEMDQANIELRHTIQSIWPLEAKNMINLLVPPSDQLNCGKLTVGKIYGGLLILESWRSTRFGQLEPTGLPVRYLFTLSIIQTQIKITKQLIRYIIYSKLYYYNSHYLFSV